MSTSEQGKESCSVVALIYCFANQLIEFSRIVIGCTEARDIVRHPQAK